MINKTLSIFADITEAKTIIALLIAFSAVVLLLMSKKIAVKVLQKKYPELKPEDEGYSDKLLSTTLLFKGIAAAIAAIACIMSLIIK